VGNARLPGVEFGILGKGWLAVGDHSRAAALFEMAAASRGIPTARKEQFRKLRERCLFEVEQVCCTHYLLLIPYHSRIANGCMRNESAETT
jgi:hypothetical protein